MKTYLLLVLLLCIGAVKAQKNNYDHPWPGFSYTPKYPLLLFGNVRSIQIEDSFLKMDLYGNIKEVDYKARRYFYDVNRKTNRVLHLNAPLDTSYDIEYLDYESNFIKKATWFKQTGKDLRWTEIDTLNKTVNGFYAKEGKVEKESVTRYVGNFRPVEQHNFEKGEETGVFKWAYAPDGKMSLDLYKGMFNSYARAITYKQGKPVEERLYHHVNSVNGFSKNDLLTYKAEAVYGRDGAIVHFTYFGKKLKVKERFVSFDNKGLIKTLDEINDHHAYSYDENGNQLSVIKKDSAGQLTQQIVRVYNERQDVVKETMEWYGDHTVTTYTYVYDDKGNWVKQFRYKNNRLESVITRKIEYY